MTFFWVKGKFGRGFCVWGGGDASMASWDRTWTSRMGEISLSLRPAKGCSHIGDDLEPTNLHTLFQDLLLAFISH